MDVPNVEAPTAEEKGVYPAYPQPLHTGNIRDDDADVMDRMLQENPEPGLPYPNERGEVRPAPAPVATRLLTGTATLSEAGTPQQLMRFDPNRRDLHVFVTPVDINQTADSSQTNTGAPVTGPAPFTTLAVIAAATLPDGWYTISGTVQMTGTTAAADINNMRIATENNVLLVIPINPGTAGTVVNYGPIIARLNGSESVRINNPGAATGTAIYQAELTVSRIVDTTSLAIYSPVRISSDVASLAADSVSTVVNAATSPDFELGCHTGELWAVLPDGSVISTVKISWIATTK